jgi:hypothetical protein
MNRTSIIPPRPVYLELAGSAKTGYYVTVYSSSAKRPTDVLGSLSLKNNSDRALAQARRDAQKLYR